MHNWLLLTVGFQLFFLLSGWAQNERPCNIVIEGYAFDLETKKPLAFVTVQIKNSKVGTVADENGYFLLKGICEKENDLIFSYLGYKTVEHHHDFHHPKVNIYMAPDEYLLQSIVVEAERNQSGINSTPSSKLAGDALAEISTGSLGEVVSQITGVQTISSGQNVVKPVIHGLHSNRILIVNDGLRHEFQNWGADHAPEIDPSLVDRLEVIKGAGTVRYGPDALGGVILINPPQMELSSPWRGSVKLTGKSNGRSGEAAMKLQKGYKWWSAMASGSYLKQGDLHAPAYQLTNTGKEERSYVAGLRIHPLAELDIEGYYSHFEQELGLLRGSVNNSLDDLLQALEADIPNFTAPFSYDIGPPKQGIRHDLYKVSARWIGEKQSILIQYGHQTNRRKEFDVRRGNDQEIPNINLKLVTQSMEGEWQHPEMNSINGKLGIQWSKQTNDNIPGTNTIPFIPNYDQDRFGIYLIETLDLDDHLFEAGLRYDWQSSHIVGRQPNNNIYRNDVDFENLTATLGYKRKFNEYSAFRTNFGTAWRPPNIAELYRFGRHLSFLEFGLWRYELDTEKDLVTTQTILTQEERPIPNEVGYKWINSFELNRPAYQLEVTGYINFIENYIYARPAGLTRTVRGTSPFFIYDQSNALFWGFDMSAGLIHSPQWSSVIKGSYLWSKQLPQKHNFVGQPPAKLSFDLVYQPSFWFFDHTRLQLSPGYTFQQFQTPRILTIPEVINAFRTDIELFSENAADFDITPPPPGYLLVNFSWTATYKYLQWNFRIHNLFNTRYRSYTDRLRYYADDLGRNFMLSLSYSLQ